MSKRQKIGMLLIALVLSMAMALGSAFAADDDVSFEQLVTILARLCATSGELSAAGSDLSAFADGDLASSWSRGAFAWAAANGLVQGYDEPTGKYLRPGDPVARERVAVVLMRAFEMGIMK